MPLRSSVTIAYVFGELSFLLKVTEDVYDDAYSILTDVLYPSAMYSNHY